MAQRDKGGAPDSFETGLPSAQSGEDVPRWLVGLGSLAGVALLIALLRYAIDLLGVVFVIILVGFAIRAISDWLTEGESVSGWAMSAVSLGLTGTVLVAIWLVNSGDVASNSLQRLPGPVQRTVAWMESKGWGQRVLLSGDSGGSLGGSSGGGSSTSGSASPPAAASVPRLPASGPVSPPPSSPVTRPTRRAPRSAPAAVESRDPPTAEPSAPAPAPEVRTPTQLLLTASPSRAVVGRSVRLTAQISGASEDAAPTGTVVFRTDNAVLGRVPVRNGTAVLVTLSLAIGDHTVSATYDGDSRHLPSQSPPVVQTVIRQ
jgi:hypothetical protein